MSSGALARCCFWLVVVFLARTLRPPLKSQEQPPVKPPGHLPWEEPHRHAAMCTNSHLWSHFTTTLSHLRLAGLLKKTAQVARSEEELVWTNSLALSGLAAHLEPAKAMVGKIARSDWGLYLSIQCPDNAWLLSRRINNRVSFGVDDS
ncbi:hypothetical protein GE21DRAFT_1324698 [Neurospora crassa]|uniref:Uncharacterized protein B22L22.110 n=1 Tax=Neurospora crassa TaxID=5141 RepID=Q6MWT6_NEUCS|nr:hypothetical protein GE21DRAFT_1324698 [Neurospora crassa]CAE55941.1 hypothetical protein [Neurospora crassa]